MPEDLVIHIPMLRRRAMALVRNQDRADDLVQDTLLRALESNHQYSERGLLKAWLCTVMRNLFISNLRRDKWVTYTDEPPERSSPSTQEDGILLEEALSELSSLPKSRRSPSLRSRTATRTTLPHRLPDALWGR